MTKRFLFHKRKFRHFLARDSNDQLAGSRALDSIIWRNADNAVFCTRLFRPHAGLGINRVGKKPNYSAFLFYPNDIMRVIFECCQMVKVLVMLNCVSGWRFFWIVLCILKKFVEICID